MHEHATQCQYVASRMVTTCNAAASKNNLFNRDEKNFSKSKVKPRVQQIGAHYRGQYVFYRRYAITSLICKIFQQEWVEHIIM